MPDCGTCNEHDYRDDILGDSFKKQLKEKLEAVPSPEKLFMFTIATGVAVAFINWRFFSHPPKR